jgi:hypothetical protein
MCKYAFGPKEGEGIYSMCCISSYLHILNGNLSATKEYQHVLRSAIIRFYCICTFFGIFIENTGFASYACRQVGNQNQGKIKSGLKSQQTSRLILWGVTPCSLVGGYECLGSTYCTHIVDRGPKNEGSRFIWNVYNRISKYTSSYPTKQNLLIYESTAQKATWKKGFCNMLQTGQNNTERQSLFYRMSEKSSLILSIYLSIYLSMVLQSFCWTLADFSVSWSYTQSAGLLGRDQPVVSSLPIYRTTKTLNKCTQISMLWVGFEPTTPAFEWEKKVRAATVIGTNFLYRVTINDSFVFKTLKGKEFWKRMNHL